MDTTRFDLDTHLARLHRDGWTLIEDFLDTDRLRAVRAGLAPFLGAHKGRNNFEGYLTERVYTLVARGKVFEDIAEDARVLELCAHFLDANFLLTASQAICIHPGETAQPVHTDDSFYPLARPHPEFSLSTIVAVDSFTAENGGTEIISGSHQWDQERLAGAYDGRAVGADDQVPCALETRLRAMEIPAGACLVFSGALLHRGGANRSAAARLAFSNQYCQPWVRTQENFFLGVPPSRARQMSPRLQSLLGYSIHPPFMGHVTASHPSKALQDGYVNAVLDHRADDGKSA